MKEIVLKFSEPLYEELRALVLAGIKSPLTNEGFVMAGAQLLHYMSQTVEVREKEAPGEEGKVIPIEEGKKLC